MNIVIKAYPAKNGDCFLISFGTKDSKQTHIIIDCGYADTVTNHLINDLEYIGGKGEYIDKLVLTHIDADHISGAIALLKANNTRNFIQIKDIWLNTYRHLFHEPTNEPVQLQEQILRQVIARGYPLEKDDTRGSRMITAKQGTTVGALILQGGYSWNEDFNNNAVIVDTRRNIFLNEYAKIFLLSPDNQKLEKLKILWNEELKRYGINFSFVSSTLYDDAFEMLLAWEKEKASKQHGEISASGSISDLVKCLPKVDTTATNGSSIAFILEIQEKKLLFLSDSHPDLIVKSLNEYQREGPIKFDFIKVSHHGSFGNISQELLNKIDATRFLFSTNGRRNNHPDKETIAHIINQSTDSIKELYFNYTTKNSAFFDREDWRKEYHYSINYLDQLPYSLTI